MKIKMILLPVLLLSVPALSATQQAVKSPSELHWASEEEKINCFGNFCAKFEGGKKPSMFDKLDKVERRRMTDPFSANDSDPGNNNQTFNFSFGENN